MFLKMLLHFYQLPADVLRKAGEMTPVLGPCHHTGEQGEPWKSSWQLASAWPSLTLVII